MVATTQVGLTDQGLTHLLLVCQTTSTQQVALSVFVGQARSSRNMGQNVAVQGKGKEPRIGISQRQFGSAGTDLHPQTGHLLPRTNGSQMLKEKFTAGRRGTKCCGGSRHHLIQHEVTYGLWIENRGEKNQRLHSWARERPTGVGAAAEGPHAAILLIALSEPITKKAMIGEATPTREMWVPRQDWGSVQGVLR